MRALLLCLLLIPISAYTQVSGTISRPQAKRQQVIVYRTEYDPVPVVVRVKRPPPTLPAQVHTPTLTPKEDEQPTVTFDTRPPAVLIAEARANLTNREGPYDIAITNLRSVILTEKPDVAKEARELLGYAYEKSKQFEKAKIEYRQYLNLYGKDDDWTRVQQRLMALEILEPTEQFQGSGVKNKPRTGDSKDLDGTVSEYAYFSNGIKSMFGLQTTYKFIHDQYTQTYKFRFTSLDDFQKSSNSKKNLAQAYWDFEDTFEKYGIRIGRQPALAGAVSRFDGISGRYKINTEWSISGAIGYPYNGPSSDTNRFFQGISADWRINQDYTAGFYYNRQSADGLLERSAFGTEVNYGTPDVTGIFRFEYDLVYKKVNQVSLQGMRYIGDGNVFFVVDKRRSPLLFADVALGLGGLNASHQVYNSVGELLNRSGLSSAEIYEYITNTTQMANSYVIGGSLNLTKQWTLTTDFQMTNLSTTQGFVISPQFDPVPVKLGMKNNYSINFHLKAEDLFRDSNTLEIVLSKTTGALESYFVTVSDIYQFAKGNVSLSLRDDITNRQSISGIFRVIYNVTENGTIETQVAQVLTIPGRDAFAFYLGYRYNF